MWPKSAGFGGSVVHVYERHWSPLPEAPLEWHEPSKWPKKQLEAGLGSTPDAAHVCAGAPASIRCPSGPPASHKSSAQSGVQTMISQSRRSLRNSPSHDAESLFVAPAYHGLMTLHVTHSEVAATPNMVCPAPIDSPLRKPQPGPIPSHFSVLKRPKSS